jgi:HD superfamily phosphodiesterase
MTENGQTGYPDRATAERELEIAGTMNPGPWIAHSEYAARACAHIAEKVPGMDAEKAYILGLLHDIGRRAGVMQERHMLEGYRYCAERGWHEQARICVSHSFMIQDISSSIGQWDMSDEDRQFMADYVKNARYDDYDRLVQLCDSLAMFSGFCLLEKRFVDVCLRYGAHPNLVPRWRATFAIKDDFERRIGCPVYDLLPGVRENTFAG